MKPSTSYPIRLIRRADAAARASEYSAGMSAVRPLRGERASQAQRPANPAARSRVPFVSRRTSGIKRAALKRSF